jgi:putative intracellular protease/amidase
MVRRIGVFVFEDFQILDATGPLAAFELPSRGMTPPPYRLEVLSLGGGTVRSSCGLSVDTAPFAPEPFDTLVVAGGEGTRAAATCPKTLAMVRAADVRRLASVCSGAFVLAAAGLLDERRAATHWRRAADLQRRFPKVRVEPDAIWVRDGHVWTSAGITAGIDLALALIADDLGEAVARRTAQELVVYHRRPGGQSQHSALLDMAPRSDRVGRALAFARAKPARATDGGSPRAGGGDEPSAVRPNAARRDRPDPGQGGRAPARRSGQDRRRGSHSRGWRRSPATPASATPTACAKPSSAASVSRLRRFVAPARAPLEAEARPAGARLQRSRFTALPSRSSASCKP